VQAVFWVLIMSLFSSGAQAGEPEILLFQSWKNQQILEAQNQVLRTSAKINSLRAGKPTGTSSAQLSTARIRNSDPLTAAEKDLRRFQESLAAAQNLGFEEYITVYVSSLRDRPEAVSRLAEKLSREELTEVMKSLVRQMPRIDAKRNSTLLGSLSTMSGAHAN
jgi:hypothetical protein